MRIRRAAATLAMLRAFFPRLAARLEDLGYGYIDGSEAAVRKYPLEGIKKDEGCLPGGTRVRR